MKPPCKKNHVDCPKRHIGCRKNCKAWKEYQDWIIAQREQRRIERLLGDIEHDQYCQKGNNAMTRYVRKLKDAEENNF